MSDIVIRVENLGKRYRIGARRERYYTLRDSLAAAFTAPWRRITHSKRENGRSNPSQIWALEDISFEVKRGEVLGIIGHNGAGKTTLLKVLARITEPTQGRATVQGRVGTLLEVGTGFHPELTGRENVYLSGAILGMKKAEIDRKFDEIVAFAEVEKFTETPVKRYSTGMNVRLGFAVAAHLEPEILMVDEVLAVGDASFQQKCLGKMGSVAREGRTVLFVSHNMGAVTRMTDRCICLEMGHLVNNGEPTQVVREYLSQANQMAGGVGAVDLSKNADRRGEQDVVLRSVALSNQMGQQTSTFLEGEPIKIDIGLCVEVPVGQLELWFQVSTLEGTVLFASPSELREPRLKPGRYNVGSTIEPNNLRAGTYSILLKITSGNSDQDTVPDAIQFRVERHLAPDDNPVYARMESFGGSFRVDYEWSEITPV